MRIKNKPKVNLNLPPIHADLANKANRELKVLQME